MRGPTSTAWAARCTIWLSGRPPYGGQSVTGQILLHRDQAVPSLRAVCPDAPDSLEAVFGKMLAKRPEERQQSMAELIAELGACELPQSPAPAAKPVAAAAPCDASAAKGEGPAGVAHPSSAVVWPAAPAADGRPPRRRNLVAAAAAGFAAVLLLSVVIATVRTREGTLTVEVNDAGVTVQVFDEEGKVQINRKADGASVTLAVDPGKHQLRMEKDGMQVFAQDFTLTWGEKKTIRATLQANAAKAAKPAAASASPPPGAAAVSAAKARAYQQLWASGLGAPAVQANSIGMHFVLIPPGEFEMGSTDQEIAASVEARKKDTADTWSCQLLVSEGPRHPVTISKPFYLGTYAVTQGEYQAVMGANPSSFSGSSAHEPRFTPALSAIEMTTRASDAKKVAGKDTSRHPVETISWEDATEFCRKLSALPKERAAQRAYRLPTEAEWEYACPRGNCHPMVFRKRRGVAHGPCLVLGQRRGMSHPVGQKKPNAWGLYDTYGSVWQWCADWFSENYYRHAPSIDPPGAPQAPTRVLRGGAWNYDASNCRSAFRFHNVPSAALRQLRFPRAADLCPAGRGSGRIVTGGPISRRLGGGKIFCRAPRALSTRAKRRICVTRQNSVDSSLRSE